MNQHTLGEILFYITGASLILVGSVYTFSNQLMPYHLTAMATDWGEYATQQQTVMLALLTGAGSGFIASGTAIACLTLWGVRRGLVWARWTVAAIAVIELVPTLYSILQLTLYTPGRPPLIPTIMLLLTVIFGVYFTRGSRRSYPRYL